MTYNRHSRQQAGTGSPIHLLELSVSLTAATVFSAAGDTLFSQTWKVSLVMAYSSSTNVMGSLKSVISFQSLSFQPLDFCEFRSLLGDRVLQSCHILDYNLWQIYCVNETCHSVLGSGL